MNRDDVSKAIGSLKDFQRATVDYVVKRMQGGQRKFLIADEVGLGKTIVARGILARLYEAEYSKKKSFRVIYICSNQALASQNLTKLNFITSEDNKVIDYNNQDDRLTSLAYQPKDSDNEFRFNIKALTPATSFDGRRRAGRVDERVLLYRLLLHVDELRTRRISLRWFLRGGQQVGEDKWEDLTNVAFEFEKLRRNHDVREIRQEVYEKFRKSLKGRLSEKSQKAIFGDVLKSRSILDGLFYILEERKHNHTFRNGRDILFKPFYGLIAELRLRLSYVCKEYLKANLFILDEFQKFSQLIKTEEAQNEGEEIARAIFSEPNARVLLLSATPFKAYTNGFDEHQGEDHYKDFLTVLRFLQHDRDPEFWHDLKEANKHFFKSLKDFGNGHTESLEVIPIRNHLQDTYRQSIVRTERSLVEQTEKIIESRKVVELKVQTDDIHDFIAIDEIILAANKEIKEKLNHPVEYVKSSPFPLSFLQDYDHHKVILSAFGENPTLQQLIRKSRKAFVPIERINSYRALLPERSTMVNEPNPKLRLLYDETVRNLGYRLLWIPPSLKYYQPKGGAFANTEKFSKTLIFSAWKMVPKMISALVSYEAERLSIGKLLELEKDRIRVSYHDKNRYPRPLLTFKKAESSLSGMNNLMLAYPSPFLASLYNPAENVVTQKELSRIRKELQQKISRQLREQGILRIGDKSGSTQKWDWLSVLFLDKGSHHENALTDWLKSPAPGQLFDNDNETDSRQNNTHGSAKEKHFAEIRNFMTQQGAPEAGKLNATQLEKLAEHLAELCLGGPGICALRAIRQNFPNETEEDQLTAALDIGMGLISMFNKPESIAVVKTGTNDNFYYQNVLSYCVEGNIQAMLDEFLYQLSESAGMDSCLKAAELTRNILMVSSSKVDVLTERSFTHNNHFSMRTHYAVPFGSAAASDLKSGKRQIKVREAFNSPFRPFVLSSTSIGQEGLDFHFYCKKIIHWNLPSNPIDLEQREGRVKRYKGLAVRKCVADQYRSYLSKEDINENLWKALFEHAAKEKEENGSCDLIPFWHIAGQGANIESIVPLYQYSKDQYKYKYIREVLTNYRLTFGQPNQQELIDALAVLDEERREEIRSLLISLCPFEFAAQPDTLISETGRV